MVNCPVCDAGIDLEEDEVDEGDTLSCDECGAELRITGTSPLEIESADEDDEDDDEDEDDLDDLKDDEDDDDDDEDWK